MRGGGGGKKPTSIGAEKLHQSILPCFINCHLDNKKLGKSRGV